MSEESQMLSTRGWLIAVAGGLVAALVAGAMPAAAQKWPQRAVKFVVPLGPGSGVDIGTRLVADKLSKKWGQPTVVENRPGGDGLLAINAFVTGNDDHVLLASPSSSFTHHPHVYRNLSYKPSDLVPIARLSNTIIAVAVPASLPVKSLADVAAMARAEPGPSAAGLQSRSSRAADQRQGSSPQARAGSSSRRSSVVPRIRLVSATRPYRRIAGDHRKAVRPLRR
jgi:tripartite-type tricarboxylate transporter receptor subunit TctC